VIKAWWFYARACWRNRRRSAFAKVNQPVYVIGLVFGFLCAGGCLLFPFWWKITKGSIYPPQQVTWISAAMGALLLLMTLKTASWDSGVPIAKAELRFLLGAPLSRRQILGFWFLNQLPGLLLLGPIFGVMLVGFSSGHILYSSVVIFLSFYFLSAANLAARQWTAGLRARGANPRWCSLPFYVLLCTLLLAPVLAFRPYAGEALPAYLQAWLWRGPLWQVLWPFLEVGRGLVAQDLVTALPSILGLSTLCALLIPLCLRTPAPFEEDSLQLARGMELLRSEGMESYKAFLKERKSRSASRGKEPGARRPLHAPFDLTPTGPLFLAIVWKNLIASGRHHRPKTYGVALAVFVAIGAVAGVLGHGTFVPVVLSGALLYMTLLVGISANESRRQDLRLDIPRFTVLKSYPLPALQVLHGEVLGMALVAFGYASISLCAAAAALSGFPGDPWIPVSLWQRGTVLTSALLVTAAMCYGSSTITNLMALHYSSWVRLGKRPTGNLGMLGGVLLGWILQKIVLGLALLLPALASGLLYWGLVALTGAWFAAAPLAALVLAGLLIGECVAAIHFSRAAYDAFDLSSLQIQS
jgi:hypothetical protein